MAIDINEITFEKAREYLPDTGLALTFQQEVADLLENDDYWQMARRYKGPLPQRDDWVAGMDQLRKSYAPILKARECAHRHKRGVIGREPLFETVLEGVVTSRKERQLTEGHAPNEFEKLADAADAVQGSVWDERGEHKIAKAACYRLISAGTVFLRYDVPPGALSHIEVDGETLTGVDAADWSTAYRLTHMELCPRDTASVIVDPATMREVSFYSYREPDSSESSGYRDCVQISAVDENGLTHVRIVKEGTVAPEDYVIDTGGAPLVVRAELDPLVTRAVIQLQDLACSIATMVKINSDVAGFPQVDAIDLETATKSVPDPDRPGQMKEVPVSMPVGPRTMQARFSYADVDENGVALTDEEGKPFVRTGRIQYREPVSSQPLRDDIEFFNTEIYRAMNQAHIATQRSADSSAELLVQERADYADSLLETKPDLERLLRKVFKARLCMAADLANDAATLTQFKAGRVRVDLRLNAGPISVEEKTAIIAELTEGLMTKETAMVLLGDVDDVDAEMAKLEAQRKTTEGLNPNPVPKPALKGAQ